MHTILLDRIVETDYGQFDLIWAEGGGFDGEFDRFFDGQVNGLVGASDPCGIYLHFARRSGGSPVRIVLLDTEPPTENAYWEDVVEVSLLLPKGRKMRWASWGGEDEEALSEVAPGSYRLRVSAKGRNKGQSGEFAHHPVDTYVLQLWPAPPKPDAILRSESEDAKYWHAEVGHRR